MLCTELSRAPSPLRAGSSCVTPACRGLLPEHTAPKYSNSFQHSKQQLRAPIQGDSSSFSWVVMTNKGSATVSGAIHAHTGTREQRKTCTEHLQEESSGGSGEALSAPRDEYSDSFLHIAVTLSVERPKGRIRNGSMSCSQLFHVV